MLCRDCAYIYAAVTQSCPGCGSSRTVTHAELVDLDIAHIDCDAFYASVEKRDNPSLRDRPVIVGHSGGRGVVTTACYVARKFGPRSAMPMYKALQLCPHAVVIPPDMAKYKKASAEMHELFLMATPLVEPVSLDEAYLDLSPKVRRIDRPAAILLARLARAVEQRVGVTVSVGLSYNKSLAKLASDRDKPRGFAAIGRVEAKEVLAQLPVFAIHGIGEATAKRLAEDGITMVAQLQNLPEAALVARFGKFGRAVAQRVQGEDSRRVVPDRPSQSISLETTLARDLTEVEPLAAALKALVDRLAMRLQRSDLGASTVVLKLKTSDFRSLTRQERLPHPTCKAAVIFEHGLKLLGREANGRAFRMLGIGVGDLVPGSAADPRDLFENCNFLSK